MRLQEVRAIARGMTVKLNGMSLADLIRTVQRHEGNFDCFGTADRGECDQETCRWREDCFACEEDAGD